MSIPNGWAGGVETYIHVQCIHFDVVIIFIYRNVAIVNKLE